MKLDATLATWSPDRLVADIIKVEEDGYCGLFSAETQHDPFLPLVLAAEHSTSLDLGTCIAVAFPRSPMHLANLGHDLQTLTKGRFILGLGSQVRTHIERRFSSEFAHPVDRMRDLVCAVRAIWRCWNDRESLHYEGEYYRHTLMTPFFDPGPTGYGPPRVFVAAVGERMTEMVGEVGDGLFVHTFTTAAYLADRTLPALGRGLAGAGRCRDHLEVSMPILTITGADERERHQAAVAVRRQIAFYGATPAYRPVLEHHGWGDLQIDLNLLAKKGAWEAMGDLITDEILDAFAISGSPEELPDLVHARYTNLLNRVSLYAPYDAAPDTWCAVVAGFRDGARTANPPRDGGLPE